MFVDITTCIPACRRNDSRIVQLSRDVREEFQALTGKQKLRIALHEGAHLFYARRMNFEPHVLWTTRLVLPRRIPKRSGGH